MRRPHRTIETFDISLMAVVTKAMGAFLVLMLLLLPYYTPNKKAKEAAAELVNQLQDIRDTIDRISQQLDQDGTKSKESQQALKVAADEVSLSLEIVAKLKGLLNKALTDLARLERDNTELKKQNEKLADSSEDRSKLRRDLEKAQNEVQDLRNEVRQLKDKLNNSDRTVVASFVTGGCNDIVLDGIILNVGGEDGYTWTKDKKPIPPGELPFILVSNGGDITRTFPAKAVQHPNRAVYKAFGPVRNSIVLRRSDIGIGEYAIALFKKSNETWRREDRTYRYIVNSNSECRVFMSVAGSIGDNWSSLRPVQFTITAADIGGVVVVASSTNDGLQFRPPAQKDHAWFAAWMKKAEKFQGKKFATPNSSDGTHAAK